MPDTKLKKATIALILRLQFLPNKAHVLNQLKRNHFPQNPIGAQKACLSIVEAFYGNPKAKNDSNKTLINEFAEETIKPILNLPSPTKRRSSKK